MVNCLPYTHTHTRSHAYWPEHTQMGTSVRKITLESNFCSSSIEKCVCVFFRNFLFQNDFFPFYLLCWRLCGYFISANDFVWCHCEWPIDCITRNVIKTNFSIQNRRRLDLTLRCPSRNGSYTYAYIKCVYWPLILYFFKK